MSFFETLKAAAADDWRAYTEHAFTNAMAEGSLPEAAFRHYLVQDYLFLIEFARAYALAAYKAPTLTDMRNASASIAAILDVEMDLHIKLCANWDLAPADIERAPAAAETLAYTRYVLDAGMRGDLLALKVALSPCVIGYAEIARRLAAIESSRLAAIESSRLAAIESSRLAAIESSRPAPAPSEAPDHNPYHVWIAEYAGAPYQALATKAAAELDHLAERYLTPRREAELLTIFREATRLEADFWEMAWRFPQPK